MAQNSHTNDKTAEKAPGPRARDGGEVAALVAELESDSSLHEAPSINAMVSLHPRVRVRLFIEQVRGLDAVVQCWNAKKQSYEEKPDFATRQKCATWLGGYSDGLPPQTNFNVNENLNRKPGAGVDMTSPAMIEAMERRLEKSKRQAAAKGNPALPPAAPA